MQGSVLNSTKVLSRFVNHSPRNGRKSHTCSRC